MKSFKPNYSQILSINEQRGVVFVWCWVVDFLPPFFFSSFVKFDCAGLCLKNDNR